MEEVSENEREGSGDGFGGKMEWYNVVKLEANCRVPRWSDGGEDAIGGDLHGGKMAFESDGGDTLFSIRKYTCSRPDRWTK